MQPLGERHSDFDVWKGLAERLGFGEYFPWNTEEELADFRLAPLGLTFKEVATEKYFVRSDEPWTYKTINPRTGRKLVSLLRPARRTLLECIGAVGLRSFALL